MGVVVKEIRPPAPATHPCGLDAVQARSSPHGQASELAEGQKSAHVKRFRAPQPPSANQERWRSGSNSPRKTAKFAIPALHLAEGGPPATRAEGGATDGTQKH